MKIWFYLFVISAIIFSALSFRSISRHDKLQQRGLDRLANCGLTGYEVARVILSENNLDEVSVQKAQASQKATFKPKQGKRGAIYLPANIFEGGSLSAIAITAHQCGHALKYSVGRSYLAISRLAFALFWILTGTGLFLLNFSFIFLVFIGNGFFLLPFWFVILGAIPGVFHVVSMLRDQSDATRHGLLMLEAKRLIEHNEASFVKQCLEASLLKYVSNFWLFAAVWSFAMAGTILLYSSSL
ncbi:MAG: zinc metallopeptidase [Desmonostoc vinosum HA7617-LM4]|jgi:Zn-dependent membrane protease YugP|nr:zinc metallopeptidase [Desmonostoc vinosum HA7617-LM4]